MITGFTPGCSYRHLTAKDLDIHVVKVRYKDGKRSKLLIWWLSKTTGQPQLFGDKLADNIVVKAEDYKYWSIITPKGQE